MNAINNAVAVVLRRIPKAILRYGLTDNSNNEYMRSIDSLIISKVIRPIVMMDMNLYGANQIMIPISKCKLHMSDETGVTFSVPNDLLNNRDIVVVNSLTYNNMYLNHSNSNDGNSTAECDNIGSGDLLGNLNGATGIATSDLTIVSRNTIYVREPYVNFADGVLTCIVENDAMLNNISTRSYKAVSNLVLLAVKAYIYNEVILQLNEGYIQQGHSSDNFKSIITEWSDKDVEYEEYFELKWRKISFMNDRVRRKNFISNMFGNTK